MIEVRYKDAFFLRKGHNGMNRLNEILIERFSLFLILTKNFSEKSRVSFHLFKTKDTVFYVIIQININNMIKEVVDGLISAHHIAYSVG